MMMLLVQSKYGQNNDGDASIYFGVQEIADGIDNNCNGIIEEF